MIFQSEIMILKIELFSKGSPCEIFLELWKVPIFNVFCSFVVLEDRDLSIGQILWFYIFLFNLDED